MKIKRYLMLATMLALSLLLSCSADEQEKAQKKLPTATITINSVQIKAELAVTDEQKQRGLMFRTAVPDGAGMLFVYTEDRPLVFWMKNTIIPLSIAYLAADGTIVDILDMQPLSLAGVPSSRSVRYALEVSQGWFAKVGIRVGDKADLTDVLKKL